MPSQYAQTAVLLFSLPAALDATRKGPMAQQAGKDGVFWASMGELTRAKVRAADLPCVFSAAIVPHPDYSASFGSQLQTAVSATLAQGYERVIVIGNDCPDLRVSDLRTAARALASGQLPVGYDRRGGVFLFGLDQRFLAASSASVSQSFETLAWQTRQLGSDLTVYLSQTFGAVVSLSAVRADWNEQSDLRAGDWLMGAFSELARQLWQLIIPVARTITSTQFAFFTYTGRIRCLRGPPVDA